jgi:signal peptidase II
LTQDNFGDYYLSKIKLSQSAVRWIWISILIIVLDQLTKWLIVQNLAFGKVIPVLPFFNLTLLYNMGAAFSLLGRAGGWTPWLFGGFAVVISVLIIIWMKRIPKTSYWLSVSLALILGGALGNLIDRIHQGYVVDFIQVYYQHWYWPAFNIADSAITVGAIMLGIEVLFMHKKSENSG